jgi:hypothetical protein
VYRLDPERAVRLLPAGFRPRLLQGYAIGAACYTRLGSSPLFRLRGDGGSDHLAYRFAVQRTDGSEATWIARRETSSWLEARCGRKLLRRAYGRAEFRVKEDVFAIELAVEGERGEEFYFRGEACGTAQNSLFASHHALEEFLGDDRPVRPQDVFAPEADELDLAEHFAPEPLAAFEARCAFFADEPFGPGAAELDSAWRVVVRRLQFAGHRRAFRVLPRPDPSSQALPTS